MIVRRKIVVNFSFEYFCDQHVIFRKWYFDFYISSCPDTIEFFTVYTKLAEIAVLISKDLTTAKKATSNEARPDAKDYYWFRSPLPNQLS